METTKSVFKNHVRLHLECDNNRVSLSPFLEYPYDQYALTLGGIRGDLLRALLSPEECHKLGDYLFEDSCREYPIAAGYVYSAVVSMYVLTCLGNTLRLSNDSGFYKEPEVMELSLINRELLAAALKAVPLFRKDT